MLALPLLASAANIHMAGDSTMANYPAKRAPLTGWVFLHEHLNGIELLGCGKPPAAPDVRE